MVRETIARPETPERILIGLARVMTARTRPDPIFVHGLQHESPGVRRAFVTAVAPTEWLLEALLDDDEEVVSGRRRSVSPARLRSLCTSLNDWRVYRLYPAHSYDLSPLRREVSPCSKTGGHKGVRRQWIIARTQMSYWLTLQPSRRPQPGPSWPAGHSPLPAWFTHEDHRVRAAVARHMSAECSGHAELARDPDPTVRWYWAQHQAGQYTDVALDGRYVLGERMDSPSLDPPYGLRAGDDIPQVSRAHAALAICQARFDMNLGVAVRSAEAAGFKEVFFVGRGDYLKSPARGADLAIPVRHMADPAALVRYARNADYQLVAVQQTASSIPYHEAQYPPRPLFIVGSEDVGMPSLLRERADLAIEIPQYGVIDSLNVAAASTVVLFHWRVHHGPQLKN